MCLVAGSPDVGSGANGTTPGYATIFCGRDASTTSSTSVPRTLAATASGAEFGVSVSH
jgi:hypothetical protein